MSLMAVSLQSPSRARISESTNCPTRCQEKHHPARNDCWYCAARERSGYIL